MRPRTALLATVVAILALMPHAAMASLGIEVSGEPTVRATSRALTMSDERGSFSVICEVQLTLTLARTVPKWEGAPVGAVTRAEARTCSGGRATFLAVTLPWSVSYVSFSGTLPNITSVRLQLNGVGVLVEAFFGLGRCLYGGNLQGTTGGGLTVTEIRVDEAFLVPLNANLSGFACPASGRLRSALAVAPSPRLRLMTEGRQPPPPLPIVISMGDSFISGEGGRWAGNTVRRLNRPIIDALGATAYHDEAAGERTPGCHRSRYPAIRIGGADWANTACSGAIVRSVLEGGGYKPGLDAVGVNGRNSQIQDLAFYAAAHPNRIKMIALSIGGNDFGFGTVVKECIRAFIRIPRLLCSQRPEITARFNNAARDARAREIKDAILLIRNTMAANGYADGAYKILVVDYISPIPPGGAFRYPENTLIGGGGRGEEVEEEGEGREMTREPEMEERQPIGRYVRQMRGGCGFSDADATWANNTALPQIVSAIERAVADAALINTLRLRLRDAFLGRRLCEQTVGLLEDFGFMTWQAPGAYERIEWVVQARIRPAVVTAMQLQELFHPNYLGQLALRNCLRRAFNNGAPIGGTCTRNGNGLDGIEPRMQVN